MNEVITRARLALGAAAVLALLVVPVALAASDGGSSGPQATASGVKQKVKKLTKKVNGLSTQLAGLQGELAALQGEQGGARPPSGTAGGDLTGNYPNPSIANLAVTTPKLANGAVTTQKLADDSINSAKVLNDTLGGQDIDESSLGTVPSATSATNATSADTVDGLHVHEIGFASLDSLGMFLTIFNKGGLTIEADCDAGPDIQLRATTTANNAYIRVTRVSGTAAGTDVATDFDVSSPLALGGTSEAANYNLTYLSAPAGVGGNVVFATFTAEETNNVAGSATDCFVRGRALSNAP